MTFMGQCVGSAAARFASGTTCAYPHDRIHPLTLSTGTWSEVVKDTLLGAINTQLVQPGDEIVSIYHR